MIVANKVSRKARIGWLEQPGKDFPFYDGQPVALSSSQWLIVITAVAVGFACITINVPILTSDLGLFVRTLMFPAIPLVVLRMVAGPYWRSLFHRVRGKDFGWMLGFAVLNLVVSILVGLLVMKQFGAERNLAVAALADLGPREQQLFFLRSIPQLFGEEVLTMLPFLAILYVAYDRFNLSRTRAFLLAWVLSSILFGLVHLPSYNWNLFQCLVVIGSARLVLSIAYVMTKNIWVSTGAHIINDWTIFGLVLIAPALGGAG